VELHQKTTYLTKKNKRNRPIVFFPSNFSINFAKESKIISDKAKRMKFYYPVVKKEKHNNIKFNLNQLENYNLLFNYKKNINVLFFVDRKMVKNGAKGIFFL